MKVKILSIYKDMKVIKSLKNRVVLLKGTNGKITCKKEDFSIFLDH